MNNTKSNTEEVSKSNEVVTDASLFSPPRTYAESSSPSTQLSNQNVMSAVFQNELSLQNSTNFINIVNAKNVKVGNSYTVTIVPDTSSASILNNQKAEVEKTEEIKAILMADCELTHKYMDIISKEAGENWRNIFRRLDYEEGHLDIVYETHYSKGVSEIIYQLLLDWIRTDDRTLGEICTLLWDEGKYSLVQNLAQLYRKSSKAK